VGGTAVVKYMTNFEYFQAHLDVSRLHLAA